MGGTVFQRWPWVYGMGGTGCGGGQGGSSHELRTQVQCGCFPVSLWDCPTAPFPSNFTPQKGCRFKVRPKDSSLVLGLLYLENYIKRPGVGRGGTGGVPLEEKPALRARLRLPQIPRQVPEAGLRARLPVHPAQRVSLATSLVQTSPASLGNHTHPSRPPSEGEWGPPRPRPPLGQVPAHAQPWQETSPPSDRVPAPPARPNLKLRPPGAVRMGDEARGVRRNWVGSERKGQTLAK